MTTITEAPTSFAPPVGWTARQASQLAGVPERTVQHWALQGVLRGSVEIPADRKSVRRIRSSVDAAGRSKRLYALGDIVAARVLHDLRQRGVPMCAFEYTHEDGSNDLEGLAFERWRDDSTRGGYLIVGPEPDASDGAISFCDADEAAVWQEQVGDLIAAGWIVLYPLDEVTADVIARVDEWLKVYGQRSDLRPDWL